jgi:hypothetical protein
MRQAIGMSPFHPADLLENGFAVDRGVALFSTNLFPTLLVPVADPVKVAAALEKIVGERAVLVREHRGVRVTTSTDDDDAWGFAIAGDWLVVHVGFPRLEGGPLGWLDDVLDAAGSGADADLIWAHEHAPSSAAVAVVRIPLVLDAMNALQTAARKAKGEELDCTAVYAKLDFLGRAALWASFSEGKGEGGMFIELSPAAAEELSRRVAGPPDSAFLALRGEGPAGASLSIDTKWLGELARGMSGDCAIQEVIEDTDLDELDELVPGGNSAHLAFLGARTAGRQIELEAAVWIGVGDERAVREFLDVRIPKLLRGSSDINGTEVEELRLDLVGIAGALTWVMSSTSLRLAVGRGVMERLLGEGASVAPSSNSVEIAWAQLQPDKLPDTRPVMDFLVSAAGWPEFAAEAVVRMLASFRRLTLSLTMENSGLRLSGSFELR